MEELTRNPLYEEARRHARALRGFYSHALVYVLVNFGLAAINLLTSPERVWFGFPMLGWGIGLLAHGLSVFAFRGWFGPQWEERKIREYLDRR
jgi:hypothetical protein